MLGDNNAARDPAPDEFIVDPDYSEWDGFDEVIDSGPNVQKRQKKVESFFRVTHKGPEAILEILEHVPGVMRASELRRDKSEK